MRSALGGGAPKGVWGRLTDAYCRLAPIARAWVDAGRPRDATYVDFCAAEDEYNHARTEADAWDWSADQAAEWDRLHRAFDPATPGQVSA